MSVIKLKNFQVDAIDKIHQLVEEGKKRIILQSGTGSGKTIILSHYVSSFLMEHLNYVTIWFSPGRGNLELQSKAKMDMYIPNSSTCVLQDVLGVRGFLENDIVFINWELVTKVGNRSRMEGEQVNLDEAVQRAHSSGLKFLMIIDEEHVNKTIKAKDVIDIFNPDIIIRASATPGNDPSAELLYIPEELVKAEGLIKNYIIINEGIGDNIRMEDQTSHLIDLALNKYDRLKEKFSELRSGVNPLIIVQVPNNSEILIDKVEEFFVSRDISCINGKLAIWLAERKENIENIESNLNNVIAIIIKQAVAVGWDCPRAHILVKLRENMDERFEIQTIGRIRRMPEGHHYDSNLLNNCYLYTFDEKFSEGVKLNLRKDAFDAKTLFLKQQHREFSIKKEKISEFFSEVSPILALQCFEKYLESKYSLVPGSYDLNENRLKAFQYDFSKEIIIHTVQGEISSLRRKELNNLDKVSISMLLNTTEHGRQFHHAIGDIARSVKTTYDSMAGIVRRIFSENVKSDKKYLTLAPKELYTFIINNTSRLKSDFLEAFSDNQYLPYEQPPTNQNAVLNFYFSRELIFTYNSKIRARAYEKNVYEEYLSSAEPRSQGEKLFERYCETSNQIDWFFKNGDKGNEYFSVVYKDNANVRRHFYPDYIVGDGDKVWIIEVKGGETTEGISENIDPFSDLKMRALKEYATKYSLLFGFVRLNRADMGLYISTDQYVEEMTDPVWTPIEDIF